MPPYRHPPLEVRDAIREVLAGAGLTEVVTHALVSPQIAETFRWESVMPPVDGGSPEGGRIVTVTNPLSVDHSVLRPALVGSLVQAVSTNVRHGTDDVTIFEIGKGYGFDAAVGGCGGDRSRVVAAGSRRHRCGRTAFVGPAGPTLRSRRRQGRDRTDRPAAPDRRRGVPRRIAASHSCIRAGRPRCEAFATVVSPSRAGSASCIHRSPTSGTSGAHASSSPSSTSPASAAVGCRRSWPRRLRVILLRNATSRSSSPKIAPPARSRPRSATSGGAPAPVDEPIRRLPRRAARAGGEEPGLPVDLPGARSDPRRGRSRRRDRGDHARDRIGSRRSGQDLSPVAVADSTLLRCGPPCSRPRGFAGHR